MTETTTKKFLVAFDPKRPFAVSRDFLVPVFHEGRVVLWGLRSKQIQEYGLIVYTGHSIGAGEVLTRARDAGRVVESVDAQIVLAGAYIEAIKNSRVGLVCRLSLDGTSIVLEETMLKASGTPRKLP